MTPTPPPSRDETLRRAHVVVVGAGGIGCPAAWALAEAGVGRLTVIDPDTVEPSNLPRQVLYGEADVSREKALVAAERLARFGGRVEGVAARLDDLSQARILEGADLLVDATDGAPTKDWLNAVAVRRGLPLVHAAALRSEGRLLEVPAGGRPCLACLFGRLTEEQGSCADLGVWGGVVGAVGFLAAAAVLRRLAEPSAPSRGYVVLDVEGGRGFTLGAEASTSCPVCGDAAPGELEPYPAGPTCTARTDALDAAHGVAPTLDLVGESCPLNLLRARRSVEELEHGGILEIRLGAEGAASVPDGLRALGHEILETAERGDGLRLLVRRGPAARRSDAPLERDVLLRYARQVVLPEVGEGGQRRLLAGAVEVGGRGAVAETAAVYLRAAGVGRVTRDEAAGASRVRISFGSDGGGSDGGGSGGGGSDQRGADPAATLGVVADDVGRLGVARAELGEGSGQDALLLPVPVARALGALLADAACRVLVGGDGKCASPAIVLGGDGTIASRQSTAVRP